MQLAVLLAMPTSRFKTLIFGITRMCSLESIPYTFDYCYHWGSESPLTFLTCRPLTMYRLDLFPTRSDIAISVWSFSPIYYHACRRGQELVLSDAK